MPVYIPSRLASQKLGLHPNTLRKLADNGNIDYIKVGQQRRYNVDKYIKDNNIGDEDSEDENPAERIIYCRVSSKKQSEDLNRQIKFVQKKYPKHRVITDVGSGINFKRQGLQEVLELAMQKRLKEVVVPYKDRLARIGSTSLNLLSQQTVEKSWF